MNVELLQRISEFIHQKITPGVASHGGSVEILEFENNILKLALNGACTTCSMEKMSGEGISNFIMEEFPELDDCQVVDLEEALKDGEAAASQMLRV